MSNYIPFWNCHSFSFLGYNSLKRRMTGTSQADDYFSQYYLPLLVDELLRTFTAQTVNQLGVIASVAANQFAQQCGPFAGLSGADWSPGTVGDSTLQDGPGEGRPAVWRQQVETDRSTASTFTKDSHLFERWRANVEIRIKITSHLRFCVKLIRWGKKKETWEKN